MDQGPKREMATPDSEIMLKNLDKFTKKWKDAEFKDWHVINGNVMDALDRIRVHISKGCFQEFHLGVELIEMRIYIK